MTAIPPCDDVAAQYHFADFTHDNYRTLLRHARSRYRFAGYTRNAPESGEVIWRHDVDYSVHAAHDVAVIEAEEGVQATYFFRLHSEMYNLLEKPVTELARRILALGHVAGLHFDVAYDAVDTPGQLAEHVAWEAGILERMLGQPIDAFSFHQPTPLQLTWQAVEYGGRINSYAGHFQHRVGYVSDSNGYWRHRRLGDVLNAGSDRSLQVLTHPEWWTPDVMSPAERIERCIAGRASASRAYYRHDMASNGRINVGG